VGTVNGFHTLGESSPAVKNQHASDISMVPSSNMGRPRFIPAQHVNGVKIHRSVKTRMEAGCPPGCQKYTPRPDIRVDPTWID
jgi:hypothetical protein